MRNAPVHLVTISAERAFEVIAQNKKGERPESLEQHPEGHRSGAQSRDILADNSLTRFDGGRKGRRGGDRPRHHEGSQREASRGDRSGGDTRCASSAALAPAERRGSKALAPPETLKTKSKPYP